MDKKKLAVGAAAATLLTLGGGTAIAAQNPTEATGAEGTKQEEQNPNIKGTIAAPAEKDAENETAEKKQEAAESQNLQSFAKIDQASAEKAALDAVPGTVRESGLGNENGFVVWEVEVAANDGTMQEVKVDAGSGQVLAQEVENGEGSGANEAGEDAG